MRKSYLILIIIFSCIISSCRNDFTESETALALNLTFNESETNSRSYGVYGNILLIEAWVTEVGDDVITSGINKDTPAASSTTGNSVQVTVEAGKMSQFILKVEFDTERVFMGFVQVFVSQYTQSVDIALYETPTSSNINTFNELDEYIQNNF